MKRILGTGAVLLFAIATAYAAAGQQRVPVETIKTATPIKHLVIIFNENVSFDHYFATYPVAQNPPGEPAFSGLRNTPLVDNLANANLIDRNPNYTNRQNGKGASYPFRLDRTQANTADQDHAY